MNEFEGKVYVRSFLTLTVGIAGLALVSCFWAMAFIFNDIEGYIFAVTIALFVGTPSLILILDHMFSRIYFYGESIQIKTVFFKTRFISLKDIFSVREVDDGIELRDESGRRLGVIYWHTRNYKSIRQFFLNNYILNE